MTNTSSRRGRWRTGDESRKRILDAARTCFGEHGYDRTTVRTIAEAAGVDPSMVYYFFDTKARLFSVAMELPSNVPERLAAQLDTGTDGLGDCIVRQFLTIWDQEASVGPLLALMRSAPTDSASASMFVEFMEREIVARLRDQLQGDDAELRADLIASQLTGLALMRYVVRLEPLASAPADEIAVWMGAALQQYFSGRS
ncbi:TetR/AcrR family transcriptional regulator [Planctomonas sp. JC2975]|uniref:TetR/AcrR family transcriptional regulator n=1 Tax=Planctomonas sp. JC2975 TaxID=2729626 RepID=UPI001472BF4B|nr:TetR family transcriptional regulator [Planctomonas sp. JC2975]NNC12826.1 TetR/AcrR family transcriptional regulator [Planctomonas sp. JC2975]